MVKILVVGDFHGEFPKRVENKIKKIKPCLILSQGDFCGYKKLETFFFKRIYAKEEDEISEKDKKTLENLGKIALRKGMDLVKKFRKIGFPIYAITGNWDLAPFGGDIPKKFDKEDGEQIKKFKDLQNKNFKFVDLSLVEFSDFVLVGGTSSTSPQRVRKNHVERLIKKWGLSKKQAEKEFSSLKKGWEKRQKLYDSAFEKAIKIRKEKGKKIVFLTHNCPYKTKLDIIKKGPAKGEHYGSYQEKLLIKKYKPDFVFCGHLHENFGKDKIGKTVVWNVGSARDGKAVLFESKTGNVKKIKFI